MDNLDADDPRRLDLPDIPSGTTVLQRYLGDLAPVPTLTRQQEVELGRCLRERTEAFRAAVLGLPLTARVAVRRWKELRSAGRSTASLSARWRDPGADDPGSALDGALSRLDRVLARSGSGGPARARAELARADLSMAFFEDVHRELRRLADATAAEARRESGLAPCALRARLAEIDAIHAGLMEARNVFVRHNLKLVVHLAKDFRGKGVAFADLIQEGNLGLIRAVEKFDPERGFKFSTYGAWWLRQSFVRALQNHSCTIRLPSNVHELAIREKRVRGELGRRLGRDPENAEVADALGVKESGLEDLHRATRRLVPLDAPSPDEDGLRISDRIADPAPHDPLEGLATERLAPVLHDLVDRLEPRAQQIIRLRFGLDGGESQSLQEIGDLLGLSRERVRQIEARTLEKMRSGARRCGLHTLLDGDAAAIPALAS